MNDIKDKLYTLIQYFDMTRQRGHTTAMMQGAQNSDCLVMTHTMYMGEQLKKNFNNRKITTVTPDSLNRLRGMNKPLLLDNGVLYTIFWDCLAEIDRLEKLNEIRKDAFAYATEPRKRKKKKCK